LKVLTGVVCPVVPIVLPAIAAELSACPSCPPFPSSSVLGYPPLQRGVHFAEKQLEQQAASPSAFS